MIITAHSGADNTVDNTISSVEHMLTLPCNAIEVDVHTENGVVCLGHDEGDASVTLETVLNMVRQHPDMRVNCDMKNPHGFDDVMAVAVKTGTAAQILFTGNRPTAEEAERVRALKGDPWFNLESRDEAGFEAELKEAKSLGIHWLNANHCFMTEKLVARIHEAGFAVNVWTVNEPEDAARMKALGVDGMTTKHPAEIAAVK